MAGVTYPHSRDAAIRVALEAYNGDNAPIIAEWHRAAVARVLDAHLRFLAGSAPVEAGPEPASPPPWRPWRRGNCALSSGKVVGQSTLIPERPWSPVGIWHQTEAAKRTTVMIDGDADAVAHRVNNFLPALAQLAAVTAERDRLAAELARENEPPPCSVCAGTGEPISGLQCVCGGSGLEQDEIVGLRTEVARLRRGLERMAQLRGGEWEIDDYASHLLNGGEAEGEVK